MTVTAFLANGRAAEAKAVHPKLLGLIAGFPRNHPSRLRAVEFLGIDNDKLLAPEPER